MPCLIIMSKTILNKLEESCKFGDLEQFKSLFNKLSIIKWRELNQLIQLIFKTIVNYESVEIYSYFLLTVSETTSQIYVIQNTEGLSENFVINYIKQSFNCVYYIRDDYITISPEQSRGLVNGLHHSHLHLLIDFLYQKVTESIHPPVKLYFSFIKALFKRVDCQSLEYLHTPQFIELANAYSNTLFQIKDLEALKPFFKRNWVSVVTIISNILSSHYKEAFDFLVKNNLVVQKDKWMEELIKNCVFVEEFFNHVIVVLDVQLSEHHFRLALRWNSEITVYLLKKDAFKLKKEHVPFLTHIYDDVIKQRIKEMGEKFESTILLDCIRESNYGLFLFLVENDMVNNMCDNSIAKVLDELNSYGSDELYTESYNYNTDDWNQYWIFVSEQFFTVPIGVNALRMELRQMLEECLNNDIIKDLINIVKEYI